MTSNTNPTQLLVPRPLERSFHDTIVASTGTDLNDVEFTTVSVTLFRCLKKAILVCCTGPGEAQQPVETGVGHLAQLDIRNVLWKWLVTVGQQSEDIIRDLEPLAGR